MKNIKGILPPKVPFEYHEKKIAEQKAKHKAQQVQRDIERRRPLRLRHGIVEVRLQTAFDISVHNVLDIISSTPREYNFLVLRFGLNGDRPRNYTEVGRLYNLTGNTVSKSLQRCKRKAMHPSRRYALSSLYAQQDTTRSNVSELVKFLLNIKSQQDLDDLETTIGERRYALDSQG